MKTLKFNNFYTVGPNATKQSVFTPPRGELSKDNKSVGLMVFLISTYQTKQNKLTKPTLYIKNPNGSFCKKRLLTCLFKIGRKTWFSYY